MDIRASTRMKSVKSERGGGGEEEEAVEPVVAYKPRKFAICETTKLLRVGLKL